MVLDIVEHQLLQPEPHLSLVQASRNAQLLQSLIKRRLGLIPQLLSAVCGVRGPVGSRNRTRLHAPRPFVI